MLCWESDLGTNPGAAQAPWGSHPVQVFPNTAYDFIALRGN